MVLVPIARELIRQGIRGFGRYYNLESKAFNKLYTGFPRSRLMGRAVRHGLTTGSVAGTLINVAPDSPGNELQKPFQKRQRFTPGKSYQTRRRFTRRNFTRCPTDKNYRQYSRRR